MQIPESVQKLAALHNITDLQLIDGRFYGFVGNDVMPTQTECVSMRDYIFALAEDFENRYGIAPNVCAMSRTDYYYLLRDGSMQYAQRVLSIQGMDIIIPSSSSIQTHVGFYETPAFKKSKSNSINNMNSRKYNLYILDDIILENGIMAEYIINHDT